jgi:hypothetical protein
MKTTIEAATKTHRSPNPHHLHVEILTDGESRAIREIGADYIAETLNIYREEFTALKSASWDGVRIEGNFMACPYPFTKPGHIDYVTAAMASLYLSQLSYVAARLLIEDGAMPEHPDVDTDYFRKARDKGDLVITALQFRFRKKVPADSGFIKISQSLKRAVSSKAAVFAEFDFTIEDSAAAGSLIVAMPLPSLTKHSGSG